MNLYTTILLEFLLVASSILILFKFRVKLGLAPLYILLGSLQYLQANLGSAFSFNFFADYVIYPGSIILFSAVLFAVLLIYIKEGVASARALIIGIVISNIIMTLMFEITYLQEIIKNASINSYSLFRVDLKYFIGGTTILILDFLLLFILYQYLVSRIKKLHYFAILFITLFSILIFDAIAFNVALFSGTPLFKSSLVSHLVGKSLGALVFSILLYFYVTYFDNETKSTASFIANQNRDIFSIFKYRKRYINLKAEKAEVEKKLVSQIESALKNISDGFVSLDTNWCYTYVNIKAGEILGRSPESLIGKHIWTEFPEGVGLPFYNLYYKAVETQQTQYLQEYYPPFRMWLENRIYPSPEGLTIYFTDITEKKEAESNNQMLLSLIETSDDFVGLASLEGVPIYLNSNGRSLVGLAEKDALPASITEFFPENYHDIIINEHIPSIYKERKWNGEVEFKNFKTGKLIPIEMSGFLIRDKISNEPMVLGIVATNITERKKIEGQIIESEKNLDTIINNIGDPLFVKDEESRLILVNDAFCAIFNLTRSDIIGKTLAENVHPDEQESFLKIDKQVLTTGVENVNEETLTLNGTDKRIISTKKTRFIDDYGHKFLIGVIRDITDRKNAEIELKQSEEKFSKAFESNVIGKAILNKEKTIIEVNDALANIVGFKRENMLGKTAVEIGLFNFDDPKNLENEALLWSEFSEKGYASNIELKYLLNNGKELFILISLQALQLYNEDHVMITVVDITEKKNAEAELEKYRNNLEELVKIRTEEVNFKNAELQRMNKLFVGRELKMKELKNIIKELQSRK
ncbi:PAS domain S-box protein [Mariniflexile aquimaris]|uniref:PAS domain S-box protein n=1 Tax=Mariniflexile aquimaris TaxID=881009 RepID=A0ABW3BPD5_9FLAO